MKIKYGSFLVAALVLMFISLSAGSVQAQRLWRTRTMRKQSLFFNSSGGRRNALRSVGLYIAMFAGLYFGCPGTTFAQFRHATVELGREAVLSRSIRSVRGNVNPDSVKAVVEPDSIARAWFDTDHNNFRIHGLRQGTARITFTGTYMSAGADGEVGAPVRFSETIGVTVLPGSALHSTVPQTVRDYFMLLPEQYFVLEGCEREKDTGCRQARLDYLREFAEVEDTKNGYIKGGCDGAQSCMEMAIFKRPNGTHLVGLLVYTEDMNHFYFLDYKNGTWKNVSARVIPRFSKKNYYELPRYGTTVRVWAIKVAAKSDDSSHVMRRKVYDLVWKNGRFTIRM